MEKGKSPFPIFKDLLLIKWDESRGENVSSRHPYADCNVKWIAVVSKTARYKINFYRHPWFDSIWTPYQQGMQRDGEKVLKTKMAPLGIEKQH